MSRPLVIYHGPNCADGFTSAWAAWRKCGETAEYLPAHYGQEPPDVSGRHVFVLDFSYPREIMLSMWKSASWLSVVDHHKSAEADLAGLGFATFDMNRSGAGLTWDVLHPNLPRPALIDYVEDRDIWKFALPFSKEINAVVASTEKTWSNWEELNRDIESHFEQTVKTGAALIRQVDLYVATMVKQARRMVVRGVEVPVVNAPYWSVSELVGRLASTEKFAVGWGQLGDGKYVYSLRSRGDFDVAAIAESYGGGGHKPAAGFHSECGPESLFTVVEGGQS